MFRKLVGGYTPAIPGPNALSAIETVTLGGVRQSYTIRSHDRSHPILLFLHGGPGGTEHGALFRQNAELEKHFTVVHLDQRGAGKSYHDDIPPQTMTLTRIVDDAHELILHLCQQLGQQKVFVFGHSWGTAVGLVLAYRYPEVVHAYIGVNQVVNRAEEESISYSFALAEARLRGNRKVEQELVRIGAPVNGMFDSIRDTISARDCLGKVGGVTANPKHLMRWAMSNVLAPEFTWPERLRYLKALKFSMNHAWSEMAACNFPQQIKEIKVPVFFVAGRKDRVTNAELAKQYLNQLKAPYKQLLLLEQAGHLANYEQPELFCSFLIDTVRPVGLRTDAEKPRIAN